MGKWILAFSFSPRMPIFSCPRLWSFWFLGLQNLGFFIPVPPGSQASGLGIIPSVSWFSGLWVQTELYHWLFWSSSLQMTDYEISSQVSVIYLLFYYLYISYCFCFFAKPWVTQSTWDLTVIRMESQVTAATQESGANFKRPVTTATSHDNIICNMTKASERGIHHLSGMDRISAVCFVCPSMPIFRENLSNSRICLAHISLLSTNKPVVSPSEKSKQTSPDLTYRAKETMSRWKCKSHCGW